MIKLILNEVELKEVLAAGIKIGRVRYIWDRHFEIVIPKEKLTEVELACKLYAWDWLDFDEQIQIIQYIDKLKGRVD